MGTPIAGPGKFSQRTDRQPIQSVPNADYGEQKAYKQLQQDAPMAAQQGVPSAGGMDLSSMFQGAGAGVVPLSEGSQQPNTPVTDGANAGPGLDASALGLQDRSAQDLQSMANQLPVLEWMGNQPNASWGLRNLVRQIKGSL